MANAPGPLPVSITTSLPPVLMTSGANWIAHLVLRHEGLLERGVDFFLLRVEDEGIRQREGVHAVGNHSDLDVANLVAIEARRLLVGDRRGGFADIDGNSGAAAMRGGSGE